MAEAAKDTANKPEEVEWLERLEAEHDNLRAALAWFEENEPESALRLALALLEFWLIRGYWRQARDAFQRVLERNSEAPPELRIEAMQQATRPALRQGDWQAAKTLMDSCLKLSREKGSPQDIAKSLGYSGRVARRSGDFAQAARSWRKGLAFSGP